VRIIGGECRGRRLQTIRGRSIRPTSDRVKESLFSILGNRIQNARILDLFAGTGALGLEALSRGGESAVFVDKDRRALKTVTANINACRLSSRCRLICWDAGRDLNCLKSAEHRFDLVFMDPPYDRNLVKPALLKAVEASLLAPEAVIAVEHSLNEETPERVSKLIRSDQRKYGSTRISFYELQEES
jgi:16S rRNA (guanine966-N2)-methyltransferase